VSATGYWEPVRPPKGRYLSDRLRRAIAKKYMGHDGSQAGEVVLDKTAVPWLEGFRDGCDDSKTVNNINTILEAISETTPIRVWIAR
jgi:hypothetical protein